MITLHDMLSCRNKYVLKSCQQFEITIINAFERVNIDGGNLKTFNFLCVCQNVMELMIGNTDVAKFYQNFQ